MVTLECSNTVITSPLPGHIIIDNKIYHFKAVNKKYLAVVNVNCLNSGAEISIDDRH